jgi:hypothetical protein
MPKKLTEKELKNLILETLNESDSSQPAAPLVQTFASFLINPQKARAARILPMLRASIQADPDSIQKLADPSVQEEIFKMAKDKSLDGRRSIKSFGGMIRDNKISTSTDFLTKTLGRYFTKISRVKQQIAQIDQDVANQFEQNLTKMSIKEFYEGIDSAFQTKFASEYPEDKFTKEQLVSDAASLQKMANINEETGIQPDELLFAFLNTEEKSNDLMNFIGRFANKDIFADTSIEDTMRQIQAFRSDYFDGKTSGDIDVGEFENVDFALDSNQNKWSDLVSSYAKLQEAFDDIVIKLVKSFGGITNNEISALKPINEDASEFEIEDMEKFFIDGTKDSDDERELKRKIKKVLLRADEWLDRNVPASLNLFKTAIKSKIEGSINDINSDSRATRDWRNPGFDVPNDPDQRTAAFTKNLADLFSTPEGKQDGKSLANSFRKLDAVEQAEDPDRRIKIVETFLNDINAGNANFTKGQGTLGEKLAGLTVSKVLVDAYRGGIGNESGYDFENFIGLIMGGTRDGQDGGTIDAMWDFADTSGQVLQKGASLKSIKGDSSLSFSQAASNINSSLAQSGRVDYYYAKNTSDSSDNFVLKIYKITLESNSVVAGDVAQEDQISVTSPPNLTKVSPNYDAGESDADPSNPETMYVSKRKGISTVPSPRTIGRQGNSRIWTPEEQQAFPYGLPIRQAGIQGGQYRVVKMQAKNGDVTGQYHITLPNSVQELATWTIPTREQFATNTQNYTESISAELKDMLLNVKKLSLSMENFLSDDNLDKADEAIDTYIALKDQINKTIFLKDQDIRQRDQTATYDPEDKDKRGRVGVRGDLQKVTNESLITANFLKKLIQETLKK